MLLFRRLAEEFLARPPEEPPALWDQEHHNLRANAKGRPKLTEDRITGPKTRGKLVLDYMALDGVALSEQQGFLIDIELLGRRKNSLLGETGNDIDTRPAAERDGERDALERRAELFCFDDAFSVTPKANGPTSEEYLVWRKRAATLHDLLVPARQSATVELPPLPPLGVGPASAPPRSDAPDSRSHGRPRKLEWDR